MANSPADVIRNGKLKCTIWENKNKKKESFFTATLTKSYTDSKGEWHETSQLTGNEISRAGALLNKASKRVAELEQEATA